MIILMAFSVITEAQRDTVLREQLAQMKKQTSEERLEKILQAEVELIYQSPIATGIEISKQDRDTMSYFTKKNMTRFEEARFGVEFYKDPISNKWMIEVPYPIRIDFPEMEFRVALLRVPLDAFFKEGDIKNTPEGTRVRLNLTDGYAKAILLFFIVDGEIELISIAGKLREESYQTTSIEQNEVKNLIMNNVMN